MVISLWRRAKKEGLTVQDDFRAEGKSGVEPTGAATDAHVRPPGEESISVTSDQLRAQVQANGNRGVMHNLPAIPKSQGVLLSPGERDCDTAHSLGLVARISHGGAGGLHPALAEDLRGKRVVIIADADEQGRQHAQQVAASLKGKAEWVKVIELPGAKDLTQWVEHGGTKDKLIARIKAAPKWQTLASPGAKVAVPGVRASDVRPERVEWLWRNYIPRETFTLFDGDPGLGKTMLTLDVCARTTTGRAMPDGSDPQLPPAGAVIVSVEDSIADTIVPRLVAAGADLSRIRIVQTISDPNGAECAPKIPADLPLIEAAIRDVEAAVLVFDPFVAFFPLESNTHKDQDVRRCVASLVQLAGKTGVAVLGVRHLNKTFTPNPLYRGGGSIALIGAARSAFLIAMDRKDAGSRILAPLKSNLGPRPVSLKFRIEPTGQSIRVVWEGASDYTADSLLALPESTTGGPAGLFQPSKEAPVQ